MTVYVTSDLHFNHTSIIDYCNRPVSDDRKHNDWIISQLNSVITPADTVYHLGDLILRLSKKDWSRAVTLLHRLNGKWKLIPGNHDERKFLKYLEAVAPNKFEILEPIHELKINKNTFVFCHYPLQSWNKMRYGSVHLHGHLHNTELEYKVDNRFNVCFDANNFLPVRLDGFYK